MAGRSYIRVALMIIPLAATTVLAQHAHTGTPLDAHGLGTVEFPNSGKKAAQKTFIRGVAMLHSFEYSHAASSFREAQRLDKSFALAYWMEALTNRQELWGTEQLASARTVLSRLGPNATARIARARTAREKQFGAAVEALFAEVPEQQRVRAWADSMSSLVRRSPSDPEWASFAAVALMDVMRWQTPAQRIAIRDSAAALAERVFAAHPRHPGGAHFVIHANDNPTDAPRAEKAARLYAKIAPASDHALHMPSHIFVQMGLWDDAATSNEHAWAASVADANRTGDSASVSWHTLQWLQYAYLQQGRIRAARALIDTAFRRLGPRSDTMPGVDPRFALDEMRFMYASHTGEWKWAPGPRARTSEASNRGSMREAGQMYRSAVTAQMVGSPQSGGPEALRLFADSLDDPIAARLTRSYANHLGVVLSAKVATPLEAERILTRHASVDTLSPNGPPVRLITAELLGDLLLANGRGADAAKSYEQSLRMHPRRSQALLGLARARSLAGDTAGSANAYRELLVNWRAADADMAELAEAKAGAKGGN